MPAVTGGIRPYAPRQELQARLSIRPGQELHQESLQQVATTARCPSRRKSRLSFCGDQICSS